MDDDTLEERFTRFLPGLLGLEFPESRPGYVRGRMEIKEHHMAPNGFLHAASVIALADSACGRGAFISRPEGSTGFTTIELNEFPGDGQRRCDRSRSAHGPRRPPHTGVGRRGSPRR